jgi:hypothetical protein
MTRLDFGRVVATISRRMIDKCLNVDFNSSENFHALQKSSRFSKQNQCRMYDRKTWLCNCL